MSRYTSIAIAAGLILGAASSVFAKERGDSVSPLQAEKEFWEQQHTLYRHPMDRKPTSNPQTPVLGFGGDGYPPISDTEDTHMRDREDLTR